MSEFPEWIEREIGLGNYGAINYHPVYHPARDPRGTGKPIWWRLWWPFNRRRSEE